MRANVEVRTTTTVNRNTVMVINSGYLRTPMGILKICIMALALIVFSLLYSQRYSLWDRATAGANYLVLVSFADWITLALMLLAILISFGTGSILPKTSFDFIFHFIMGILILVGGILVATHAFDHYPKSYQAACILAIVCGLLQIVHGILSYRICQT